MSANFKPGDKLKCIRANNSITQDGIYTFDHYEQDGDIVYVKEISACGFYAHRFILIKRALCLDEETLVLIKRLVKIVYETTNSNSELEDATKVLAKLDDNG